MRQNYFTTKPLPGITIPVSHVFVGDESFKLEIFLDEAKSIQ